MRALAIFMAWVLAPCLGADVTAPVATIPVVHTWGELSATTPIILKELNSKELVRADGTPPVEFWVGIDRDQVTEHGAAVLYCLEKGSPRFPSSERKYLGPFTVDIENLKVNFSDVNSLIELRDAMKMLSSNEYTLHVEPVPVDTAAPYKIELQYTGDAKASPESQKGPRIAARTNLKVVSDKNPTHWLPWGRSPKEDERESHGVGADSGEGFVQMIVCTPGDAAALPKTPQEGISLAKLPPAATPLPVLVPEKPDPATVMQLVGNTLVVTLPQGMKDYSYPDKDFLTRWWINGKPWQPDAAMAELQQGVSLLAEDLQIPAGPKSVHFQLDFEPRRLGLKKGDLVGVQLLYCPEGWAFDSRPNLVDLQQAMEAARAPLPPLPASLSFASNRVEFTYSGDPASPVK